MKYLLNILLQFIYPALCSYCKVMVPMQEIFCMQCWGLVKPIVSLYLPITKAVALPVFAASGYQDPIKKLITAKFSSHIKASRQLAELIFNIVPSVVFDVDYLVPIPLHWSRYAVRGYNQSMVMAQYFSKKIGVPIWLGLKRTRRTNYQWLYSKKDRIKNLQNAFIIKKNSRQEIQGKRLLLIDDLCTTGATLQNAAKFLLDANPQVIKAVVGCRVIQK